MFIADFTGKSCGPFASTLDCITSRKREGDTQVGNNAINKKDFFHKTSVVHALRFRSEVEQQDLKMSDMLTDT